MFATPSLFDFIIKKSAIGIDLVVDKPSAGDRQKGLAASVYTMVYFCMYGFGDSFENSSLIWKGGAIKIAEPRGTPGYFLPCTLEIGLPDFFFNYYVLRNDERTHEQSNVYFPSSSAY